MISSNTLNGLAFTAQHSLSLKLCNSKRCKMQRRSAEILSGVMYLRHLSVFVFVFQVGVTDGQKHPGRAASHKVSCDRKKAVVLLQL